MNDVITAAIYDRLFGMSLEAAGRHFGLPLYAPEPDVRAKMGSAARAAIQQYLSAIEDWRSRHSNLGYIGLYLQCQQFARAVAEQYEALGGYEMGPEFLSACKW